MRNSVITYEEYLVHPYRVHDMVKVEMFFKFMQDCSVDVTVINEEIADKAAQIRAQYKDFKGMDCLQLAAAAINGCDMFFTNDKQLKRYDGIKVLTLDEFEI